MSEFEKYIGCWAKLSNGKSYKIIGVEPPLPPNDRPSGTFYFPETIVMDNEIRAFTSYSGLEIIDPETEAVVYSNPIVERQIADRVPKIIPEEPIITVAKPPHITQVIYEANSPKRKTYRPSFQNGSNKGEKVKPILSREEKGGNEYRYRGIRANGKRGRSQSF